MRRTVVGTCSLLMMLCASLGGAILPALASNDLPDLWIQNVVFTTPIDPPGLTSVSVIVWNIGTGIVNSPFSVRVSLYRPYDGATAYFVAVCSGSDLPLLQGYRWWPDVGEINGYGYIVVDAEVDVENAIAECNEANNKLHGYVDLGGTPPYPPLVVEGPPPPAPVNPRAGEVSVSDDTVEFWESYTISITIENPDPYYSKNVAITITETPSDQRAYTYQDNLYGSLTSPMYTIPPGGSKTYTFTFSHHWRWLWEVEKGTSPFDPWLTRALIQIESLVPLLVHMGWFWRPFMERL